jgi:hypothetical protein
MAKRFIDALHAGTPEAVSLAPHAVLWHNFDEVEMPASGSFATFAVIRTVLPDFRFDDVRAAMVLEQISIAQYTIKASLPDGSTVRAPGCVVVTTHEGQITRVEEYVDTAQLAAVVELVARASSAM